MTLNISRLLALAFLILSLYHFHYARSGEDAFFDMLWAIFFILDAIYISSESSEDEED